MLFDVDLHSTKPIYQQLIDQVKQALATGRLQPGERLPAIRDLAAELRVNRNTIARVYSELERDGLIYTRTGQGAFASDRAGMNLNGKAIKSELNEKLSEAIAQAKVYRLSRAELEKLIGNVLAEFYPEDQTTERERNRK